MHGAAWRSEYGARSEHDDVVGSTVLWASGRMATRNGCPCRLTVDGASAEITVIDAFNDTVWRAHSAYAELPAELGKWLTYALTMVSVCCVRLHFVRILLTI